MSKPKKAKFFNPAAEAKGKPPCPYCGRVGSVYARMDTMSLFWCSECDKRFTAGDVKRYARELVQTITEWSFWFTMNPSTEEFIDRGEHEEA